MKFIKFFCLLSVFAILAAALAENTIVQTTFFKKYLDESVHDVKQQTIQTSEVPLEVMNSFLQTPFKNLSIQKVRKVDESASVILPLWMNNIAPLEKQETLYVLSLADEIDNSIKAIISFNYKGKLLAIEKI